MRRTVAHGCQQKRKQITQPYNFKELNCANNYMSLKKDTEPHMTPQPRLTLLTAACETLTEDPANLCLGS